MPPSVSMSPPHECVSRPWAMMESWTVTLAASPLMEKVSSRPHDTLTWSKMRRDPDAMVMASLPDVPPLPMRMRTYRTMESSASDHDQPLP